MKSSTAKTILGFFGAVLEKYTPLRFSGNSIEDIYNYLQIDDALATSGQPNQEQFTLIRDAGYQTVINLAPNSVLENSLQNEGSLLASLGFDYVHIPVDFNNPTDDDFARFVNSVQDHADQEIWVHCAANMRVSAFVYRYRCTVLGEDEQQARADLETIWEPFGVWKKFLASVAPAGAPPESPRG